MHSYLKRYMNWCGNVLAIAGMAFVALRLSEYSTEMNFTHFGSMDLLELVFFSVIYCLANLMLAFAWRNLLEYLGANVSKSWALKTYGISQLAKYVPGNIFHIAGRQAIGMAGGVAGWTLARSSIWELSLIALSGTVIGLLAVPLIVSGVTVSSVVIAFILSAIIAAALLVQYFGLPAARAFVLYVIFFLVSAMIFIGLMRLVSPLSLSDATLWPTLGGAYVLAWLAGFVTPGAPAGLGIRELVLLFLLQGLVGTPDLLLAITLGRAITVSGDFVFFLFASLIKGGDGS